VLALKKPDIVLMNYTTVQTGQGLILKLTIKLDTRNAATNTMEIEGVRFGHMDIARRFLASNSPGVYFKVLQEGEMEAEFNLMAHA
jgi:hypothetical protein